LARGRPHRRDNIVSAALVGPFSLLKVGARPTVAGRRRLTFASNPDRGICVRFRKPVTGIDPTGFLHYPSLAVTVRECVALRKALVEGTPSGADEWEMTKAPRGSRRFHRVMWMEHNPPSTPNHSRASCDSIWSPLHPRHEIVDRGIGGIRELIRGSTCSPG
jgi:hypothetical protein